LSQEINTLHKEVDADDDNNNKRYLPEALKLFAAPKESENLSSFDATTTEDDSDDTSEEISN